MWCHPDMGLFAEHVPVSKFPSSFVHFCTLDAAQLIVASGVLLPSKTIRNAVFAAAVGGEDIPGVQYSRDGADVGVWFTAPYPPASLFVEEAVWFTDVGVPITPIAVLESRVARQLLDGHAGIDDNGWWHTDACVCAQCRTRLATLTDSR